MCRLDEMEYEVTTHKAGRDEAVAALEKHKLRNVELKITISHLETEVDMLRRAGPGSVHSVPRSAPAARTDSPTSSVAGGGGGSAIAATRERELAAMLEEVIADLERKETERLHWQRTAAREQARAEV